jgi:hypothetical protein
MSDARPASWVTSRIDTIATIFSCATSATSQEERLAWQSFYDRRETQANKKQFDRRMMRLNAWWGAKMLSEVTGEHCRAYQATRSNRGGARRDLEDLRAAINYHAKEGLHRGIVRGTLPRGVSHATAGSPVRKLHG